jgi:hypothetical protein
MRLSFRRTKRSETTSSNPPSQSTMGSVQSVCLSGNEVCKENGFLLDGDGGTHSFRSPKESTSNTPDSPTQVIDVPSPCRSPRSLRLRRSISPRHGDVESGGEHCQSHAPHPSRRSSVRRSRSKAILMHMCRSSSKVVRKTSHAVTRVLQDFWFHPRPCETTLPHCARPTVRGGVMLYGCTSPDEHYTKLKSLLETIASLHGAEGLQVLDLEYRMVPCAEHRVVTVDSDDDENDSDSMGGLMISASVGPLLPSPSQLDFTTMGITESLRSNATTDLLLDAAEVDLLTAAPHMVFDVHHCHLCAHRLFHTPTNTLIDMDNRKRFVADGDMFDEVTRLCQEYAYDIFCQETHLEWITIEETPGKIPIRALVSACHPVLFPDCPHPNMAPTLLIVTGRGKVRAGMFSRQHMLCSGIESSTALPMIREAVARGLNIVMVDPNAHGDRFGFDVFAKSMKHLFAYMNKDCSEYADVPPVVSDLYILSHSASGGQLARYWIDQPDFMLEHVIAIAFTDSTHNVQWANKAGRNDLMHKLQAPECIYFKCANDRRDGNAWYLHAAGEPCDTDSFWTHRFGSIRTCWAGTNEHSLVNWYAHAKIWNHFDRFLGYTRSTVQPFEAPGYNDVIIYEAALKA